MTQDTSAACSLTSVKANSDSVRRAESGVAGGCPVSPLGYDAPPVPLGPDSLTWRYSRNLPPLDEWDNPMHYCPKV